MFLKSGQDEASPPLPSFEFAAEIILSSFFQGQFPAVGWEEPRESAPSRNCGNGPPLRLQGVPIQPGSCFCLNHPCCGNQHRGGPGLDRRRKAVPRVPLNMLLQNKTNTKRCDENQVPVRSYSQLWAEESSLWY